ncbi:hypothetical protein [Heyndrickxia oleronia]|uniref:hypothetical protein n=1 Tax=Heyndrickxia oleronia TaxID=38875 RepID=UPI001B29EBEA|nr:hypothetical protein [Heyndrickxia oleronia]GIN38391.1 hypothetical protein J19TS1_13400 [Heyndrickxia oleronia]
MINQKDWTEEYLQELMKYNRMLNSIPEESRVQRIEVLSKQLVLIGKLAAEFSERYKKIYATRKRVYAEAEIAAPKNKKAHAELAVIDLREEEATAYGNMKRWTNAFESTKEEINALKYKVRIDLEDGSSRHGA